MGANRVSVYRMAAGGSSSTDPKLLAIQQWVAAGKGLNKPDQGVVNRLIAMGVVLPGRHRRRGRTSDRAVRGEPQFLHGIKNPAELFQAVGIGQARLTLMAYSR